MVSKLLYRTINKLIANQLIIRTFEKPVVHVETFTADSSLAWDASSRGMAQERKLQPCWCGLELLEQVWEWNSNNQAILSCNIDMHHKVLGRQGFEQEVEVAACEAQGLGARLRKLNEVASRYWASDPVHSALQLTILECGQKNAIVD